MTINIGIFDKSKIYMEKIKEQVIVSFDDELITPNVIWFKNGGQLLNSNIVLDLLFLNIELDYIDELSLSDYFENSNNTCNIVFILNQITQMKNTFGKNVIGFIIKDDFSTFDKYIRKIKNKNVHKYIEVNKYLFDEFDILYIEGDRQYSDVHFLNKAITLSYNMSNVLKKIDCNYMLRVHKSYSVNLYKIKRIENECLVLINGEKIPISKKKEKEVKMYIVKFMP